jgi:glucosamine-6-phosphate deaminase
MEKKMRIIKAKDYDDMSRKAAAVIASQVALVPDSTLGLATGSTMEGIYDVLGKQCKEEGLDFANIRSVNLDEYVGLTADHDQSYHYYMKTNLFDKINIDMASTNVPDGTAKDTDAECKRYDKVINELGPIDLQLLGLGNNGHIGFNEPADAFEPLTNCVELTEETITSNARFFEKESDVPKKAITMGIRSIMQAKVILLCANGTKKAEAIKKVLTGPVTPQVPGSILQLHPNLIVVADEDALSKL